jgi:hypothetical protein
MKNPHYDPESPGWIDQHPPQRIGNILGEQCKFEPDRPAPESRQQQCDLCYCNFLSVPQWLLTRWHHPNICSHCGENYSHRESIVGARRPRTIFIPNPGPKEHYCPGCHQKIIVLAIKDGAYWLYEGPCPECGQEFENLYYAYKAVPKKEAAQSPAKSPDDLD